MANIVADLELTVGCTAYIRVNNHLSPETYHTCKVVRITKSGQVAIEYVRAHKEHSERFMPDGCCIGENTQWQRNRPTRLLAKDEWEPARVIAIKVARQLTLRRNTQALLKLTSAMLNVKMTAGDCANAVETLTEALENIEEIKKVGWPG